MRHHRPRRLRDVPTDPEGRQRGHHDARRVETDDPASSVGRRGLTRGARRGRIGWSRAARPGRAWARVRSDEPSDHGRPIAGDGGGRDGGPVTERASAGPLRKLARSLAPRMTVERAAAREAAVDAQHACARRSVRRHGGRDADAVGRWRARCRCGARPRWLIRSVRAPGRDRPRARSRPPQAARSASRGLSAISSTRAARAHARTGSCPSGRAAPWPWGGGALLVSGRRV